MLFDIYIYENRNGKIVRTDSNRVSARDLREATDFLSKSGFKALDPAILGIEYYNDSDEVGAIVNEVKEDEFPDVTEVTFTSIKRIEERKRKEQESLAVKEK